MGRKKLKTTWRKLGLGDAFSIPLNGGFFGFGVVLIPGKELYLGVFEPIFKSPELPDDIELGAIRLVGWSMDELFYHGQWKVVGKMPVPSYPRPKHVVYGPDGPVVCSFERVLLRQAVLPDDMETFGYRTTVSNVAFTSALNCIHGLSDFLYDFKKIDALEAWRKQNHE
jgi:hypothetical protein